MKKNFTSPAEKALYDDAVKNAQRKEYCQIAQDLNLDAAIRTVAKSGKFYGDKWWLEWEGLSIGATVGAIYASATVRIVSNDTTISRLKLYFANEYGRHIKTFRYGPWVHRLIAHAEGIRKANKTQAKIDEAANFAEVDF